VRVILSRGARCICEPEESILSYCPAAFARDLLPLVNGDQFKFELFGVMQLRLNQFDTSLIWGTLTQAWEQNPQGCYSKTKIAKSIAASGYISDDG
jgi:hypothetical protein